MDILVSSNLERLLFDLSGCDGARIARFMGDLAGKKRYAIDDAMKAACSNAILRAAWMKTACARRSGGHGRKTII